jgi:hypothetical protein
VAVSRTPAELAGCYRMNIQRPLKTWPLPEVVELRAERSDCLSEHTFAFRGYSSSALPRSLHGHWTLGAGKHITVHWGNDFSGIRAELNGSGVDFSGRAATFSDVGLGGEESAIDLHWVKCPVVAAQPAVAADGASPRR